MVDDSGPDMPSWLAGNPFAAIAPSPAGTTSVGTNPLNVKTDAQGRALNPDGTPTQNISVPPQVGSEVSPSSNFNSAKVSPGGILDDDSAKRAVLNKIASGEANSYNEIFGGGTFNSFADHPRQKVLDPKTGKYSDAAGLYQFLGSTWDQEKTKLGLKDFSPASQDAAAWDYANTSYKQATGRDLLADSKAGHVNWSALGGQWESLASAKSGPGLPSRGAGAGANLSQGENVQNQSGVPQGPILQSDQMKGLLQLALIQAAFPQHKFTPIDYDPFKVRPVVGGGVD